MARLSERIPLQEAADITGISVPTIYRRIRRGEIRGAICIDARGKHWEVDKADLEKLTLKRRYKDKSLNPFVTSEMAAVTAEMPAVTTEMAAVTTEMPAVPSQTGESLQVNSGTLPKSSLTLSSNGGEAIVLRERLLNLEEKCEQLQKMNDELQYELNEAKDEASYWRGRWEEISDNFNSLRQILIDKNNDDQEQIWSLRDEVCELQDRLNNNA